jgi:hypothetical protein
VLYASGFLNPGEEVVPVIQKDEAKSIATNSGSSKS